eukprot:TRINITY_DN3867_c0_g2_i3.p1 TRINITY_DN3867_c0_g2~~TRINITY_DN3867_c0_g2_i3.p1  ORF type:complete len:233 (+),score=32.79 TRINITY_DN3867_c0_g2_i3:1102-1800(+)
MQELWVYLKPELTVSKEELKSVLRIILKIPSVGARSKSICAPEHAAREDSGKLASRFRTFRLNKQRLFQPLSTHRVRQVQFSFTPSICKESLKLAAARSKIRGRLLGAVGCSVEERLLKQHRKNMGARAEKKMIKEREELKKNCPFTPKTNVSSYKSFKGEDSSRLGVLDQRKNRKAHRSSVGSELDHLLDNVYCIQSASNSGVVLNIQNKELAGNAGKKVIAAQTKRQAPN